MSGRPVRILIATSNTGGGHRAMSNALAGALNRHFSEGVTIKIEDIFVLGQPTLFERTTRLYGGVIRVAPWFYGWLYHFLNSPTRYRAFGKSENWVTSARSTQRKIRRLLEDYQPDVVVNTHPLANRPLLDAIEQVNAKIPVLATVSELVSVHVSWVDRRITLFNTATTESYRAVLNWGAPPERVRSVGLPVDERFSCVETSQADLRRRMGLDPERFTALLVGGGEGAGGLEAIVRATQSTDLPIQFIVVCGHNTALLNKLQNTRLRTPTHVVGFVRTMPDLMHAADVVVTKGGPQTISEALVAGRPVVLTQTIPGQEEGNGAFVESRGIGFAPGPVRQIVSNLARLVNDPETRAVMTANASRHGRPQAAVQVAEMVLELVRRS